MERRERGRESDQLPEEAPPDEIVRDAPSEARDEARESAGGAGEEGRGTGHPDQAPEEEGP